MNKFNFSLQAFLFFTALFVAFVLRFYQLGNIPPSLDWDENSNAYNAYSILKTGRDEYGNFLPLYNRSFGDYKPPLYMYLNIPTVAVFGLTPLAARLPSAILGFLTLPLVYLLTKKLFKDKWIPTISAFLFAISPWSIQFSRVGFEENVGLFFTVAAATALVYAIGNKWLLFVSASAFALGIYSYHSQRIFLPLLFISAILIFRSDFLKISRKFLLAFFIYGIIILLPLVILTPKAALSQRFQTTTAQNSREDIEKSITLINEDKKIGIPLSGLIHNRRIIIAQTYLSNYLSHFDLNFLFTKGDDNFRHHVQGMGMLYLWELPFMLIGLFLLIKNLNRRTVFIAAWLLLAPLAAAPATPAPHAIRGQNMLIALIFIVSMGIARFVLAKYPFKKILLTAFSILVLFSIFTYLENYYRHYGIDKASFWQYGYSRAAIKSQELSGKFEKIKVDRTLEQSYIFWLFNLKYDPLAYQKSGSSDHFDKFYFNQKQPNNPKELFIAAVDNFPSGFEISDTIYYPDGTAAFKIGHPK